MEKERLNLRIEQCNPKMMFTWQGARRCSQKEKHSHEFIELAFVLSGNANYHIDGRIVEVSAGDLLIFNPGVEHQCMITETGEPEITEFIVAFSGIKLKEYEWDFIPLPEPGNLMHTEGELKQKIYKLCLAMSAEKEVWQVGRYHLLRAYLIELLMFVLRDQSDPIKDDIERYSFESANKKYIVSQIVSYFEDHYHEKISLDKIADNMYLSSFYISRIFKSELGETPINYLINIRLEKAKELLLADETMSVQTAAACVGYKDAYYFSRLFKKKYGYAPSRARIETNG